MASEFTVELVGFSAATKSLRALSRSGATDVIKSANKKVGEHVAEEARKQAARVSVRSQANGVPLGRLYKKMSQPGANAIRTSRAQTKASIKIGYATSPWSLGLEFGSKQYRQFPVWRGNQYPSKDKFAGGAGYVIYPAMRNSEEWVRRFYEDMFARELRKFLDVN